MTRDLDPSLELTDQLLQLLREAHEGISEFQLIQQLKARHSTHVPNLPLTDKLVLFGSLLAAVNLFLALFNFVPLPPLDGGHIAGALWESARRGWAKLFHRPDPGHFDTAKLLPVAYAVMGFLIISGGALIVADIVSPMQLF